MSILGLYFKRLAQKQEAVEKEEAVEFFWDELKAQPSHMTQPPFQYSEQDITYPKTKFDPQYPPEQVPEKAEQVGPDVYQGENPYDPTQQMTYSPEESRRALTQNMLTNLGGEQGEEVMMMLGYAPEEHYPIGQSRGVDGQVYFMNDGTVLKIGFAASQERGGGEDLEALMKLQGLGKLPGTPTIHEVMPLPTGDVATKMDNGGYPLSGWHPDYDTHNSMVQRVPGLEEQGQGAGMDVVAIAMEHWYYNVQEELEEAAQRFAGSPGGGQAILDALRMHAVYEYPKEIIADLQQMSPRPETEEAIQLLSQLFRDLQQLDSVGITVWNDLHLGNILYDPKNNKMNIIDFSRADFKQLDQMLLQIQGAMREGTRKQGSLLETWFVKKTAVEWSPSGASKDAIVMI